MAILLTQTPGNMLIKINMHLVTILDTLRKQKAELIYSRFLNRSTIQWGFLEVLKQSVFHFTCFSAMYLYLAAWSPVSSCFLLISLFGHLARLCIERLLSTSHIHIGLVSSFTSVSYWYFVGNITDWFVCMPAECICEYVESNVLCYPWPCVCKNMRYWFH